MHPDPAQSCLRKIAFQTRKEAWGELQAMRRKRVVRWRQLTIYKCLYGDHWHIGNRPRQDTR